MSVEVHTTGRVLSFSRYPEFEEWKKEHPEAPLNRVFIKTEIQLRNDIVMKNEIGELDTSIEEWKNALEVKDDKGETIDDIVEATGVAPSTVRRKIKKLIQEGKCVQGEAVRIVCGRKIRYRVYQLKGEEK